MAQITRVAKLFNKKVNQSFRCYHASHLPYNEPLSNFEVGSPLREEVKRACTEAKSRTARIPLVINGKKIHTDTECKTHMPSDTSKNIAALSMASREHVNQAIDGALAVQDWWRRVPFTHKESIFMKACHLLTTKYRSQMLAATMIGQAKTAFQADVDCIGELSDFLRFNIHYAKGLYEGISLNQPIGVANSLSYRPLEGFVAAITPFNFTAIAGNLCSTPCMMGNVVLWKPSNETALSSYLFYEILLESGLPDGVIQFLPSEPSVFGETVFNNPNLACLNFTGSTESFEKMWKQIGNNISTYRNYPRLIGETGGKDYHLVHESANLDLVVNCTLRAAFEYGGQKCSACSVIYIPDSLYDKFINSMIEKMKFITLGQPDDYKTFLSAVISRKSFDKIRACLQEAKNDPDLKILYGGKCDDSVGYFIEPTLVKVNNRHHSMLKEELFGPVLSIHTYKSSEWDEMLSHVGSNTKYALTGSIFCKDRKVLLDAESRLVYSAGNLYINDKCTGSVVGQQPFGGARKSGTNDKAGMGSYILRFVSPISRKESYQHSSDILYSHMK